jgi:3-hydroxyacyl-CoA dehydrogenase
MGHGIAEVCAIHGYEVILLDISEEILQNSIQRIIWSLNKLKQSGKLKEKIEEILKK